ncbi:hypothetical protein JCM3765_003208 [Sporobolomyces pararoseus]
MAGIDNLAAKGWTFVDDSRPDSRPPRFSEEDYAKMKERSRIAVSSPLRKDTSISFKLPSLYPEAIYRDHPNSLDSPNPIRQAATTLLDKLRSPNSQEMSLKLVKGIRKGKKKRSQVWKAEAKVGGEVVKVVIKLYAEALFDLPIPPGDWSWLSQEERARREAEAYSAFRSRQGIDVPICYGFYNFATPWGEEVIGTILEDLEERGTDLWDWGQAFLRCEDGFAGDTDSDYESFSSDSDSDSGSEEFKLSEKKLQKATDDADKLSDFIHELFKTQRRLHDFNHTTADNVFVLRSSQLHQPHFVFVGFSHSLPRSVVEENKKARYRETEHRNGEPLAKNLDYRAGGESTSLGVSSLPTCHFNIEMPLEDLVAKGWSFVNEGPPSPPPPRFSQSEIAQMKIRRRIAKSSPLRKGASVPFQLPSLYPKAIYDESEVHSNPSRQPRSTLLSLLGTSQPESLCIKLVKGLKKGKDRSSQVWRAEVKDAEGNSQRVVVKMYAEALFELPAPPANLLHLDAEERVHREAQAYTTLRSRQGIDIPICYGFFKFLVPWGETVVGVILEDLNEIAIDLWDFGQDFVGGGDGFGNARDSADSDIESVSTRSGGEEEDEEMVTWEKAAREAKVLQNFLLTLFKAQRRLHDFDHTTSPGLIGNVFVLGSSTLDRPRFIFYGFSHTLPKPKCEEILREHYEEVKRTRGVETAARVNLDFRARAEKVLLEAIGHVFDKKIAREWKELELFEFV